jgi:hypothetical protein
LASRTTQYLFRFTPHHTPKAYTMFFLKPGSLFTHPQRSRFPLQALRYASGLSAAIGAKCSAAVPQTSKTPPTTPPGRHTLSGFSLHACCPKPWATAALSLLFSAVVSAQALQTTIDTATLGDTKIRLVTMVAGVQPGVQYLHVHQNEATAVTAAKAMLTSAKKGSFVTWVGQGDRYVSFKLQGLTYKFDPNRIFTTAGAHATLNSQGPFSAEALAAVRQVAVQFTQRYVDSMQLVVALHNNTDGGGLSIDSYLPGGTESANTQLVHRSSSHDPDDFFYTTNADIYAYFSKRNFNIVLQDNTKVVDDGSLSVYAGQKGIAYLNVEAQHGHLKQQTAMLKAVQQYIRQWNPRP